MSTLSNLKIRTAVLVAALSVALVSPALHAQNLAMRGRVTVPFAFEVGSTHFAAGTYVISNPRDHVLAVQGSTRSALAFSSHEINPSPARGSKVVFYRLGDQYFLREVWIEGNADHLLCPESKSEQHIERMMRDSDRASVANHTNVGIAMLERTR